MHTPYQHNLKREPDFKVKYRFYSAEEGGRKSPPYQGYRSDFWYSHPMHDNPNRIYMIWPEFLDDSGAVLLDNQISVPLVGIANMWVVDPNWRSYHADKIEIGLMGYFMEGARKVAECEVIEVVNLL